MRRRRATARRSAAARHGRPAADQRGLATGFNEFSGYGGVALAGLVTGYLATGFDPRAAGFFWLAGQGGYGVQSAPAMAKLARFLLTGVKPEGDFATVLNYVNHFEPGRLLQT